MNLIIGVLLIMLGLKIIIGDINKEKKQLITKYRGTFYTIPLIFVKKHFKGGYKNDRKTN